jgi:anaerobic selenocysteine-containing dehydrogenase
MAEPVINLSPKTWDEIKTTTCYMCACRCGIKVYLKDGTVKYIEGNRDHPVNKGVICGKGAAGIMQHTSPARLSKPLLRVGERGVGEFKEIEWDEALGMTQKNLLSLRGVTSLKVSRLGGPRNLAHQTMRHTAAFVPSIWRLRGSILMVAPSGNLANPIGSTPNIFYSLAWQKTMPQTQSRQDLANSRAGGQSLFR